MFFPHPPKIYISSKLEDLMEDLDVIVEDGKLVIVNNTKEIIKVKWVEIEYLITFNPEELGESRQGGK
jgi:hypothetical protein